jgi:hypothetical protein
MTEAAIDAPTKAAATNQGRLRKLLPSLQLSRWHRPTLLSTPEGRLAGRLGAGTESLASNQSSATAFRPNWRTLRLSIPARWERREPLRPDPIS